MDAKEILRTNTKIEWADATWNPIWGCRAVSPGCANCYAAGVATRFPVPGSSGRFAAARFDGTPRWNGSTHVVPESLFLPGTWNKPKRVVVCSMSDLFHESNSASLIAGLLSVMAASPHVTFQVTTKWPERMCMLLEMMEGARGGPCATLSSSARHLLNEFAPRRGSKRLRDWLSCSLGLRLAWPLPNLWLGVSVEDQQRADQRIPLLLKTPAAVRFVSCEPMLGPVDLHVPFGATSIDWVIAGGESGPQARPCHPDWIRGLRDWCQKYAAPFFFKQWGEFVPCERVGDRWALPWAGDRQVPVTLVSPDGLTRPYKSDWDGVPPWTPMARVGKKKAGRLLDGREWNEFPRQEGSQHEH